jgi:formate hydrogenlyase subunit 6/NADH:ubiquinone oxidoreductase subunit I
MPTSGPEEQLLPDYTVESMDEAWLRFGAGAPRHLMLDPGHCIACGDCENACPWECLYALQEPEKDRDGAVEFFMFEDANCSRCGVCVEVCPTDCLYFARLSEETGATRTLGVVPLGKGAATP